MKKMLKKGLSLLLAILMLVGTLPVSVLAEELVSEYPDFEYEVNQDGSLTITAYTGDELFITIPAEIEEAAVTAIGEGAFAENETVIEVTVSEGIESIGCRAFAGCENLNSVLIPASVTEIADDAFEGCEGVKLLCYYGTTAYSYAHDNDIERIRIYNNDDETEISGTCTSKIDWHINLQSGLLTVYGEGAIPDYSSASATPWYAYRESIKGLKLVGDYTKIGNYAFAELSNAVSEIAIADTVESIGSYAFYNCSGLTGDLIIPDSVTSIGTDTFYNCSKLSGLKLSENLTKIPEYAFRYCGNITGEVIIPDSVTTIGSYAFQYTWIGYRQVNGPPRALPSKSVDHRICANIEFS